MIPSPLIYLASLLGGVVVGLTLNVLLDWPWWLIALGFPVAVWLIFLASAVSGLGGDRSLRMEMQDILNPRGSWERHRRYEEDLFRSAPFRLYGLDASWTGLRMLGGFGTGANGVRSIELTHGDMSGAGPWVRVETAPVQDERVDGLQPAALELWHTAERPPADLPPHQKGAWMHRRFEESFSRQASWTKVPIPVDGSPVDFDWLEERNDWVARAVIGDLAVKVRAHGLAVASIRLAVVHDVEPYIEGTRRFNEEQRRLHMNLDE